VSEGKARIGVDIGGTFTDVVLEGPTGRHAAKVLTTPRAPERAVLDAVMKALALAGIRPADAGVIIHGTTLATNALIERKGARTGFLVTEGFRDSVEIGSESRPDVYDVEGEKPAPLVPRRLRLPVPERMDARGRVLRPLDEDGALRSIDALAAAGVESVAVGFLHSYANPAHEERVRALVERRIPGVTVSLSAEVSPEMREYERFSTTCANAYVQPLMAGYLRRLESRLAEEGFACPLLLMLSGGGLTTVDTAVRFPVRLVESGPAGGAVLASHIARSLGLDHVLSFDMGGTTAKICLIERAKPETARLFEVARVYRFLKGSGLPLRIPVIEMVEIGAGGGSIARVDALERITVGPDSAGAEPGPACYGQGGTAPTVTDADLALGRIDPARFAGGSVALDPDAARRALDADVGQRLGLTPALAAYGVTEIVDETMANAARVHAIERGKDVAEATMIAFGGAAPLHAARLAEKLGVRRVIVPTNAGVGSAVGFLRAPVAYEVVRSLYQRFATFDAARVNAMLEQMHTEARRVVAAGAPGEDVVETRLAYMRYVGQGHEIAVPVPAAALGPAELAEIRAGFDREYRALFGQTIPGLDIEALSWSLTVATAGAAAEVPPAAAVASTASPDGTRLLFDPETGAAREVPVHLRARLAPGSRVPGPAVIVEESTATLVGARFDATIDANGYIVLDLRG